MGHSHSSSQDDTRSVNAGSTATSEVDEAAKLVLKSEAGICSKVVLGFRYRILLKTNNPWCFRL